MSSDSFCFSFWLVGWFSWYWELNLGLRACLTSTYPPSYILSPGDRFLNFYIGIT